MFRWFSFDKTRKSAGFALVDIILGIAILSVALVGIAYAWRQSTVTTISARNYNQATYYAQQALEQLKIYDGKTVAAADIEGTFAKGYSDVSPSGSLPVFQGKTELLPVTEVQHLSTKLVPVTATVQWQESGGSGNSTRTVSVVGYYYLK